MLASPGSHTWQNSSVSAYKSPITRCEIYDPKLAHLRVLTDVLCLAKSDSQTMGTGKYIGRVGGLTVALRVGVAIATTPAISWLGGRDDEDG
jgi:hypothetical protein